MCVWVHEWAEKNGLKKGDLAIPIHGHCDGVYVLGQPESKNSRMLGKESSRGN